MEAIKEAILDLPEGDVHELVEWLDERQEAEWDRKLERDLAPGGRGEFLRAEVEAEIRNGRVRPMDEVMAELAKVSE